MSYVHVLGIQYINPKKLIEHNQNYQSQLSKAINRSNNLKVNITLNKLTAHIQFDN